ncbi:MAG: hypothetical protein GX786_08070, partial [Clostridiales bacterium]|nr:hypothetical protein [Clostridiales bacterium]
MSKEVKELSTSQSEVKTASERFNAGVISTMQNAYGGAVALTHQQKQLGQHLFIKISDVLNTREKERLAGGGKGTPYTWGNTNMDGLAIEAYSIMRLGVDAFVDDHVYIVPYFNSTNKKYDLNIRLGYKGTLYYKKQFAEKEIKDIVVELV